MSFANYAWKLKENVDEELVTSLANESGVSENLVRLCVERGIQTAEELQEFLSPTPHLIHDPFLLHDMDKAVGRIQEAIEMVNGFIFMATMMQTELQVQRFSTKRLKC